ncbi:MAG: adenylosuccinate synthase [Balneolaceae bacterium]|nr:MAG: adenylosuccinate synthase [Balneolaceae bacterium]
MAVRIVIGAQWGDEGKGKVVDILSAEADYVVRYQGGANAGHTLKFDDTTIVLHLIPSGMFNGNSKCIIGNGVVVDPIALVDELKEVESLGVDLKGRFFISSSAHLILPYHKVLDQVKEKSRGSDAIGTTGRGIGPAYVSKVSRIGIRMLDLLDMKSLEEKIKKNLRDINVALENVYGEEPLDGDEMIAKLKPAVEIVKPYITNTTELLHDALENGESVLLEGAQGSLLDVDHGTYPYVTSSSPTAGGACCGSGIPPLAVTHSMGITKAYCTRVGNGPFPTELDDAAGEKLRKNGQEFGATTGRPRRCGWLDLVALKYAIRLNGMNELTLTKLDVLDDFETIKLCTHYELDGEKTEVFPLDTEKVERVKPVYTSFEGWNTSTRNISAFDELPEKAKEYIRFIEEFTGVKFTIISTGPKRSETIIL